MKKVLLLVWLIVPLLSAQLNTKGTISLVFNGEKINLPIIHATIQKDKVMLLRFEAGYDDSMTQQTVAVQIGLKKLSSNQDAETLEDTRIIIRTIDKRTDTRKELLIWFDDNETDSEKEKSNGGKYGIYNKVEKVSWEINSVSMKIDISSIDYKDNALHINGEISGTFKSTLAPEGQTAEIKDCKFEIII
jgi:hypothetical protein